MEELYCQSCGMPLRSNHDFGSEADSKPNHDYCCYCYVEGKFTQDYTMEEMIQHCADMVDEFNAGTGMNLTREESVKMMREYFPKLKRWQGQ